MTAAEAPKTEPLEFLAVDLPDPGEHQEPWEALARQAVDPNPFFGPEFVLPFLKYMGPSGVRLCVVRGKTSGTWHMAAPIGPRRLGFLTPASSGWATHYGPVGTPLLSPGAPDGTGEAFLEAVAKISGRPLIAFPFLPIESAAAKQLQSTTWTTRMVYPEERAAHAGGTKGEKQFAKAFSGKRRKEMLRLVRRLSEQGEVRMDSHRGADAIPAFETFLKLEAAGWKGKGGTALLNTPAAAQFARQMITARAKSDGVRVDSFSVAGRTIGTLVLLLEGTHAFSWKIAIDENYARYSPGSQVSLYAMETNLDDKAFESADSLAVPGHPMIEPLWRGKIAYGTLLAAKSPAGRFLERAARFDLSLEQDLRAAARKLLKRQ